MSEEGGRKGERLYTYRYTVTTRTTSPALRWAAMGTILLIVRDEVTRHCPQTTTFEEKGEPKRNRAAALSAYQPNALPLGQTGSMAPQCGMVTTLFSVCSESSKAEIQLEKSFVFSP